LGDGVPKLALGGPPGGRPGGPPPYGQYCPQRVRTPQKRTGCAPCRGAQKGPNFRPLWVFLPLFCGRSHHVSPSCLSEVSLYKRKSSPLVASRGSAPNWGTGWPRRGRGGAPPPRGGPPRAGPTRGLFNLHKKRNTENKQGETWCDRPQKRGKNTHKGLKLGPFWAPLQGAHPVRFWGGPPAPPIDHC
jgi:hypothetical protein